MDWSVRFHMNKNNCGCDPVPATYEEHTAKAIELLRAGADDIHIDHHFKHGAGDFD